MMENKGDFKHFMLKEIHEQPRALENTLEGRVDLDVGGIDGVESGFEKAFNKPSRIYFIACGTSRHAAIAGRHWIEQFARIPATVEVANEARFRNPVFMKDDLVVAVSQSGETTDTLAAVEQAKKQNIRVLTVTNVKASSLAVIADSAAYTHAGPEIGIASTKCFTAQLAVLLMLAVYLGRRNGQLEKERAVQVLQSLREIPERMNTFLSRASRMKGIAEQFSSASNALFIGRGLGYPIALEGALKLKEVSYIHAEGYPAGEIKHGPIALIDGKFPAVAVCPKDSYHDKVMSNAREIRSRGGHILAVGTEGDSEMAEVADHFVALPPCREETLPLMTILPLQLLAYHVADHKGLDVDQPRNLVKAVTE